MQRVIKMKDILLYVGLVVGGIILICLLIWLLMKKRYVIFSSLAGLAGLWGVNLIGMELGYSVASVVLSAVLGLPGVALLLILRLF